MGYVHDNAGTQYYIRSYVIITIIVVIVHHCKWQLHNTIMTKKGYKIEGCHVSMSQKNMPNYYLFTQNALYAMNINIFYLKA